ncbi:tetratricopeptide repeat protein [Candidatus Poribacteria bacterium]|nr:tetratricopeptide repeat protein [Candidatus Poribacteria bacterium]
MESEKQLPDTIHKSPEVYFHTVLDTLRKITGVDLSQDDESLLLIEAGKACIVSGNWNKALEIFQRAFKLTSSEETKAEALKQMGHIKSKLCEWKEAYDFYRSSLEIYENSGNLSESGNIYNNLGFNHFEKGEMSKAKGYFYKALDIANEYNDAILMADTHSNLGIISNSQGKLDETIQYYQKSIDSYKKAGDTHGLAQTYHNLGMTYAKKEEWKLAGECYQKSMDLCMDIGDNDLLSIIYINRSQLSLNLYDPSIAKVYCDKAFKIFQSTENKMGIAEVHKTYGMIYTQMKDWNSAEESFEKGLDICKKYDNLLTEAEIFFEKGMMNLERGDKMKALDYLRQAMESYKNLELDEEVSRIESKIQKVTSYYK